MNIVHDVPAFIEGTYALGFDEAWFTRALIGFDSDNGTAFAKTYSERRGSAEPERGLIELWDSVGMGLIVELPTGVFYSNQTGGFSCLHPSTEGAYLPLRNEPSGADLLDPERELLAYFEGPKHRGAGATQGLDPEDADFIDGVLATARLADVVRVDRTRLAESHEAWVRVLLLRDDSEPCPVFRGLGPYPRSAVLTWENSD